MKKCKTIFLCIALGTIVLPQLAFSGVDIDKLSKDRGFYLFKSLLSKSCEETRNRNDLIFNRDNGTEFVVKLATGRSNNKRHTGVLIKNYFAVIGTSPHNGSETLAFRLLGCDGRNYKVAIRSLKDGKGSFIRAGCPEGKLCYSNSKRPSSWETFTLNYHNNDRTISLKDYRGINIIQRNNVLKSGSSAAKRFTVKASPWQHNFSRPWANIKVTNGSKPLLTVMMDWPNQNSNFHNQCVEAGEGQHYDRNYVRRMLFGNIDSVNDWYLENSHNKFQFTNAGIIGWTRADRDFADGNIVPAMSEKLRQIDGHHDFKQYDANNDGKVDDTELTIIFFLAHDKCHVVRGGFARYLDGFRTNDGVILGNAIGAGKLSSAHIYVHATLSTWTHELLHTGFNLLDMYAEGHSKDTGGEFSNLSNSTRSVHLDAVHKLKLGWVPDRAAYRSGQYVLRSSTDHPDALVVYNPEHGSKEYFVLEFRPKTGYDNGTGNGPREIVSGTKGCAGGPHLTVDGRGGRPRCEFVARGLSNSAKSGLVIWRMNEQAGNNPRRAIHIMAASGDFPGANDHIDTPHAIEVPGGQNVINDTSNPLKLRWSDGSKTGITISNLRVVHGKLYLGIAINPAL